MSSTHLGPRCLPVKDGEEQEPWQRLSRFCWSTQPEKKIIIFLHGFVGTPLTTWEHFVSLWPADLAGWDLAFFGYPSLRFNVDEHTISFLNFMKLIHTSPAVTINETIEHLTSINPTLKRSDDFRFSKIVLVAHSMGALISRRALLQEQGQAPPAPWLSLTEMVLFAPAHKGSKGLMFLEALVVLKWGSAIGTGLTDFVIPPLRDLREKSPVLSRIEDDTRDIVKTGVRKPFVATKVLHSVPDWIVHNGLFANDPTPIQIYKTSHTKVCKPRDDWKRPIDELLEVIRGIE